MAPELEALLPERLGQRPLYRWSVRGRCFLDMVWAGTAEGVDGVIKSAESIDPTREIDIEHLAMAVAGRDDPAVDPPYFVWALAHPATEEEATLALTMMFGGASFEDVTAGLDYTTYTEARIGGKQVRIGTKAMIQQGEHERGLPYIYETEDVLFLVVADDAAWAAEAIKKLP
jgi:hypothetical protein